MTLGIPTTIHMPQSYDDQHAHRKWEACPESGSLSPFTLQIVQLGKVGVTRKPTEEVGSVRDQRERGKDQDSIESMAVIGIMQFSYSPPRSRGHRRFVTGFRYIVLGGRFSV